MIRTVAAVVAAVGGAGLFAVIALTTIACFEPGPLLRGILSVGVSFFALLILLIIYAVGGLVSWR